ncbi:hypothetical protein WA1_05575, partial [Scytonema hofmannii PCC 7110]
YKGANGNGGNIILTTGSVSLTNGVQLSASTFGKGDAGSVLVQAKDSVSVAGNSYIFSTVESQGVGKGGDVNISAATLSLKDGAQLGTFVREASSNQTAGQGQAGNVNVNVTGEVTITGRKNGASGIFSTLGTGAIGKAGNINVTSGSVSLTDGAQLSASTFGKGDAGSVLVQAKDSVSVAGNSYIFSTVESQGVGKGGDVNISAATLSLKDGAQLGTFVREASSNQTAGQGQAGNVNVNVTGEVTITGRKNGASGIFSTLETGAIGKAGNINVTSGSVSLTDGARLTASTSGKGDAGSILVQAKDSVSVADSIIFSIVESQGVGKGGDVNINGATLSLKNGAQLSTSVREASSNQTAGQGQAGNVNVNVTGEVTIAGRKNGSSSGIFSFLGSGAIGKGGNINVTSDSVSLTDGAVLIASTFGKGDAGSVLVQAKDSVSVAGNSSIFSDVESQGVGKGGDINIRAATLSLKDGAQLSTSVRAASSNQPPREAQAGNVNVNVTGSVTIAGRKNGFSSGIFSFLGSGAIGKGGNINVTSDSVSLTDGARLSASTSGQGDAGSVLVQAKDSVSAADSTISSTVENGAVGKGGDVNISAATLSLKDGAQLGTFVRGASSNQTGGQGQAGNVNVNVTGAVTIAGRKNGASGIFSYLGTGAIGKGGNINVTSGSVSLTDGAQLSASTFGKGDAGSVLVQAKDSVSVAGNSYIFSRLGSGAIGKGGNINVTSGSVSLTDGAQLSASTSGQGDAGSILVQAKDSVSVGGNSIIFSIVGNGAVGKGGDVNINGATLSLKDGAQLGTFVREASSNQSAGQGQAGNANVNVTGAVTIAGGKNRASGIFSYLGSGAIGKGGNINVTSGSVSLTDGARLNASTSGQGDAGSVLVQAKDSVFVADSTIFSNVGSQAVGKGGDINISAATLFLKGGAQLSTSVLGSSSNPSLRQAQAGNVNVNVTGSVTIAGVKDGLPSGISSDLGSGASGKGGNINVTSGSVSLTDGARLTASTSGKGDAGSISVQAKDSVSVVNNSYIFSNVGNGAVGKGGDVNISAATLSLNDGAQVSTSVRGASSNQSAGQGQAGNVNVNVTGVVTIAGRKNGASGIFSNLGSGAIGKGGNINVTSGSVSLTDGAYLSTITSGKGDAGSVLVQAKDSVSAADSNIFSNVASQGVGKGGDININGATLSLKDGAQLSTSVLGASSNPSPKQGQAGNVNVNVTGAVTIAGVKERLPSGISTFLGSGAIGKGGNINLTSGSVSLTDGAVLIASTSGQGDAGSISVQAKDSVFVADSNIFSNVASQGVGKGGDININGATLFLKNDAQLSTRVSGASSNQSAGQGQAGNVNVNVTGAVTIAGVKNGDRSGIFSTLGSGAIGQGGNINVTSGSVSLTDGARLIASTFGKGDAGSVLVQAKDSVSVAGNSYIFSNVESQGVGKGGDVNISAATLSLKDGAQLSTSVREASFNRIAGQGQAGNVNVNVTGAVTIAGENNGASGIFSYLGSGAIGKGGNINVTSGSVSLTDDAQLSASTSGKGDAGSVLVQAKDSVSAASNSYIFTSVESQGVGKGGDINISAATLSLKDGAELGTFVRQASFNQSAGQGQAGNVNVNVTGAVTIAGRKNGASGIVSTLGSGAIGKGGNINITSGSVSLTDGAQLTASTSGKGDAGKIQINATDYVNVSGFSAIANPEAVSGLFVRSLSSGAAGDIEVTAPQIRLDNSATFIAESASGNGGNITLQVRDLLLLRRGSQISTTAGTARLGGDGGNISINSKYIIAIPEEDSNITANAFQGRGGNVQINSQGIFGIESRPRRTEKSDITASSDLGVAGAVNLIAPDNNAIVNRAC